MSPLQKVPSKWGKPQNAYRLKLQNIKRACLYEIYSEIRSI